MTRKFVKRIKKNELFNLPAKSLYIWYKEVDNKFLVGGPFKKYGNSNWKNWPSVLKWVKDNGYKEVRAKPLTEIELLDLIRENFGHASISDGR